MTTRPTDSDLLSAGYSLQEIANMKPTKTGIDCIHYPISKSTHSHRSSWPRLLRNMMDNKPDILYKDADWNNYDRIYLYHGMEFQGQLNLYGGVTPELANRFVDFIKHKDKFVSLEFPMPDFGYMCSKRKSDIPMWNEINWDQVSDICKRIPVWTQPMTNSLVLGDSHAHSVWEPGYMVNRIDHQTLHGVLNKSLSSLVSTNIKHLKVYFGNIDIRHHLCRRDNPRDSVNVLTMRLEEQLTKLNDINNFESVTLVHALPLPADDRVIPKSGYYEQEPFFGSFAERTDVKNFFNNNLSKLALKKKWRIHAWPDYFENENGELKPEHMEKPKSVHLSTDSYKTDLDTMQRRF